MFEGARIATVSVDAMPRQRPSTTKPIEQHALSELTTASIGIEHHRPTSRLSRDELLRLISSAPGHDGAYEAIAVEPEKVALGSGPLAPTEPEPIGAELEDVVVQGSALRFHAVLWLAAISVVIAAVWAAM
jgi:hypothetical protein